MPHDKWPADRPYSDEFEAGARAKFHELGLSPYQARGLYDWYIDQNLQALNGLSTRYDAPMAELEKEWGSGFDKEFGLAQNTLTFLVNGNKEHPLIKWLDSTGENKNPVLIRFFNELGKSIGEDTIRGGEDSFVATDDELKAINKKINDMRADAKGAFMDINHPGHKDAVQEMYGLYQQRDKMQAALQAGG